MGQIILASKRGFFSEWIEGNGLSFRINYGLKERFVVMESDKREGGEYWPYPPPEKDGWENPSSQKRVYCYSEWMSASRRFSSGASYSPGPGLRTVRGAMGGSGGMVLWRLISMALPRPFSCGAIDVRTVIWSCDLGPGIIGLAFKLRWPPFLQA
jgi:hypothetical protein